MIADTSAWIEFLRGTGSTVDLRMEAAARERALLITDPVLMEVLAGARDREEWLDLRRMLSAFDFASIESPGDWVDAAALHRRLRRAGRGLANMVDCLIAVIAIRVGVPVLHLDADFDAIAAHSALEIAR